MRKTIPIILALLCLALLIVSCKPTIGPGQAIAGLPGFNSIMQCEREHFGVRDNVLRKGTACQHDEQAATNPFLRQFWVLNTPVPGYNTIRLGQDSRQLKHRPPGTSRWAKKRTFTDYFPVTGQGGEEIGYLLDKPIQGYTIPLYSCRLDHINDGVFDIAVYGAPNCPSGYYPQPDKKNYLLGYALLRPALPASPIPSPPTEKPPAKPEFRCEGDDVKFKRIGDEGEFRVESIEDRYSIKLVFADKISAKFMVNGEITDMLKPGKSAVSADGNLKLTLMSLKGTPVEAVVCLERAGKVCCRTREETYAYMPSAEACRTERGDIVEDGYCTAEICCEWRRTFTLKTRPECSELEGSKAHSRSKCPAGVDSPDCNQLQKQCSQDISFVKVKCEVDADKLENECKQKADSLEELRQFVARMQEEYQESAPRSLITGGAVAGSLAGQDWEGRLTKIWQCNMGSPMRITQLPFNNLDYGCGSGNRDSYDAEPGFIMTPTYTQQNNIAAYKIVQCSIPKKSGAITWGETKFVIGQCSAGWTQDRLIGYSLKQRAEGTKEAFLCSNTPANYANYFVSTDPNCRKNNKDRAAYNRIASLGFWPQSTSWTYTTPKEEISPPPKAPPEPVLPIEEEYKGCSPADTVKIKDNCKAEIARAEKECEQETMERVRQKCADVDAQYDQLMKIASQLKALLAK